jgi:TM2 domain-containing membrane protein YozV
MKNKSVALVLCLFTGFLGGHQYYLGNYGKGIFYTFSAGGFIFGFIIDFFLILFDDEYMRKQEEKLKNKKSFNETLKEEAIYRNKMKQIEIENKKYRASQQVCCPKCGSSQLTANKKGFSLGKAVAGGILLVPIAGVATGMVGKNKIIITCLNCGKQFKPGKGR